MEGEQRSPASPTCSASSPSIGPLFLSSLPEHPARSLTHGEGLGQS